MDSLLDDTSSTASSAVTATTTWPASDTVFHYGVKEKALCYEKVQIYEAKIHERRIGTDGTPEYLVHYHGWNSKYDEWVKDERLLKDTPENRELAEQLRIQHGGAGRQRTSQLQARRGDGSGSNGSGIVDLSPGAVPDRLSSKKEKGGSSRGKKAVDDTSFQPAIAIEFPALLKARLVDDWARIGNHQLVPLPCAPSVVDILRRYQEDLTAIGAFTEVDAEILQSLITYFDRALGSLLLYRFERLQYQMLLRHFAKRPVSELYGGEHLLRLFVELPRLMTLSKVDEDTADLINKRFHDFLRWFDRHQAQLLLPEYENATSSYMNVCKSQ
ncbi:MRG-domain-containing protein [Blastocladiella britannica]|nr:MRG-domain-containing protein [Blastocladiella britannica]